MWSRAHHSTSIFMYLFELPQINLFRLYGILNNPALRGPVFGSNDMWKGLGIFFDSFDNDGQVRSNSMYHDKTMWSWAQITIEFKGFKLSCATNWIVPATSKFNVGTDRVTIYNVLLWYF